MEDNEILRNIYIAMGDLNHQYCILIRQPLTKRDQRDALGEIIIEIFSYKLLRKIDWLLAPVSKDYNQELQSAEPCEFYLPAFVR